MDKSHIGNQKWDEDGDMMYECYYDICIYIYTVCVCSKHGLFAQERQWSPISEHTDLRKCLHCKESHRNPLSGGMTIAHQSQKTKQELMKEVIMAILQRGISGSAMDQRLAMGICDADFLI